MSQGSLCVLHKHYFFFILQTVLEISTVIVIIIPIFRCGQLRRLNKLPNITYQSQDSNASHPVIDSKPIVTVLPSPLQGRRPPYTFIE